MTGQPNRLHEKFKTEIIKILANPGLVYSGLEELSPLS